VIEVFKAVPALPSWLRPMLAPTLGLALLVGCHRSTNPPQVMTTANIPADTTSTLNSLGYPTPKATFTAFSPQQGDVLTTVSMTGAGFNSTTGITINGVYASAWTLESDTLLTMQVPSNASSGPIMIITTLEGSEVSSTNFTVLPQITDLTPTSGPVGTVISLGGYGFVGTTRVTVGSESVAGPGSQFSSPTNANQLTVIVGHDATTGPVQLTASGQTVQGPTFTVTAD